MLLEHYSRVLVLNDTSLRWIKDAAKTPMSQASQHQQEVMRCVEINDISYVDADMDEQPENASNAPEPASEDRHSVLRKAVQTWLMWNSDGPMREGLALRTQDAPPARGPAPPASVGSDASYRLQYSVTRNWQTDPGSYDPNPGTCAGAFATLRAANEVVHEVARAQLYEALDYSKYDKDERERLEKLGMLFEDDEAVDSGKLFSEGDPGMRQACNEMSNYDGDGQSRNRVLFCDKEDESVKVIAWGKRVE